MRPTTTLVFAAAPADTTTDTTASTEGVQEVVVTAQRRSENLQDVPITIQAITGDQLQKLNVVSFNDLLKYTPNVTFSGNGPGTGNIFMRGLGGVGSGNQSQSTTAPFPNVALYLDDQSMQFPARNNDVYLVDMERVEVLEGPQGTLFGGGAQAGAIRYITNKPKLDSTDGRRERRLRHHRRRRPELHAQRGAQPAAEPGTLRAARRGASPSAVAATSTTSASTIGYCAGHDRRTMPRGNPTANNGQVVAVPTPTRSTTRARACRRCGRSTTTGTCCCSRTTRTWRRTATSTPTRSAPMATALGAIPARPRSRLPTPRTSYSSTAWTLNGKLGDLLKVVYTGSYMTRHIDGQQDYSNYMTSASSAPTTPASAPGAGYFNPANFPQLTGKPLQLLYAGR